MAEIHRVMVAIQVDGRLVPQSGGASFNLGVRVPPHPHADVQPDASGYVMCEHKGMSVNDGVESIPDFLMPKYMRTSGRAEPRKGARGRDDGSQRVFRLKGHEFIQHHQIGAMLELFIDKPEEGHAVIRPLAPMHIDAYQAALADTYWVEVP